MAHLCMQLVLHDSSVYRCLFLLEGLVFEISGGGWSCLNLNGVLQGFIDEKAHKETLRSSRDTKLPTD